MNLLTAAILILSILLIFEVMFVGGQNTDVQNIQLSDSGVAGSDINSQTPEAGVVQSPPPNPQPADTPYPEPSYIPDMRPYTIYKANDIWYAKHPESYITPDNGWVKHYASLLYIDHDGRIRYKNRPVPLEVDTKGNVLYWMDEPVVNNYIPDVEQFKSLPDADMWVMPEYYLTHGMKDDCDGWMVTVTSLMLSGEMSVLENGTFIKKVLPAKAVLGYMGNYRDGWTEYQAYGKTFLTTTSLVRIGIEGNEKVSSTEFIEKEHKETAKPVFEFTDKYFGMYDEW